MVISLVYGQIQTPQEQDGLSALETILKPSGYVSPSGVDQTVKSVAVASYIGGRQNGKFK